ncbi:unnamed protein product, partial [Aureobasidium mustum]
NAKKAEVAAQKQAVENQKKAKVEAEEWSKGAKDNSKAKLKPIARRPKRQPSQPKKRPLSPSKKTGNAKTAQKKSRGLDLSGLDGPSSLSALSATGIDNALDALSLTANSSDKIDRHPERRFKAAYTQYEERRLEEMKDEKGLRRQQKIEQIRKEFEKHPDNPFNQANASYNSTREDLQNIREGEKAKIEKRLGGP